LDSIIQQKEEEEEKEKNFGTIEPSKITSLISSWQIEVLLLLNRIEVLISVDIAYLLLLQRENSKFFFQKRTYILASSSITHRSISPP